MTIIDRPNYVVVDVETDSLNAETGHLLEIAAVVVNSELEIVSKHPFNSVVYYHPFKMAEIYDAASPYVQKMHEKNGLWAKTANPAIADNINVIDASLREWLSLFGDAHTMPVMGNSVRLDMNFMDKHLPRAAGYLDYHMRDVSTVAGLARDWFGVPYFEKAGTHTALADVMECIAELKHYRKHAFKVSGNGDTNG